MHFTLMEVASAKVEIDEAYCDFTLQVVAEESQLRFQEAMLIKYVVEPLRPEDKLIECHEHFEP